MEGTLFNIFAGLTVLSALLVVANPFSRNPVTSALFLVTTMISISGLFVLLGAYFLAAVQILVYAGAVMVLFLFVIMLLDLREAARRKLNLISLAMGIMAVGALFSVYKSSLESTYDKASQQYEVAANIAQAEAKAVGTEATRLEVAIAAEARARYAAEAEEKRKAGQEVFTDDELEEAGFLVEY